MTIKGSDITVGTTLRWLVSVGAHYLATKEVLWTVQSVSDSDNGMKVLTFVEDLDQHRWYVNASEYFETESQGMTWLDGDPNNPL